MYQYFTNKMEIFVHPASSPNLQSALKSALPHSINLVYRTQHPNRTQYADVLATFSPEETTVPRCWAAAYFDRSMRPETEAWIFSAFEMPNHSSNYYCADCEKAVLSLLDYFSKSPIPPIRPDNQYAMDLAYQHEKEHPTTGPNGQYPHSRGMYMRHLLEPKVLLVGACHAKVVQIFRDKGMMRNELPGGNAQLSKFVFKLSDLPTTRELPEELRWGEMREQDIDTVKSRTAIPRTTSTLLSLRSVGVFEKESVIPVAWTFLGLDGSLTTLHTEPQYRGMGIAKAVAAKIIREYAPGIAVDDEGNAWCHADVYHGNIASESVCDSLGGEALWTDYWVRIDLGKAGSLANGA